MTSWLEREEEGVRGLFEDEDGVIVPTLYRTMLTPIAESACMGFCARPAADFGGSPTLPGLRPGPSLSSSGRLPLVGQRVSSVCVTVCVCVRARTRVCAGARAHVYSSPPPPPPLMWCARDWWGYVFEIVLPLRLGVAYDGSYNGLCCPSRHCSCGHSVGLLVGM